MTRRALAALACCACWGSVAATPLPSEDRAIVERLKQSDRMVSAWLSSCTNERVEAKPAGGHAYFADCAIAFIGHGPHPPCGIYGVSIHIAPSKDGQVRMEEASLAPAC